MIPDRSGSRHVRRFRAEWGAAKLAVAAWRVVDALGGRRCVGSLAVVPDGAGSARSCSRMPVNCSAQGQRVGRCGTRCSLSGPIPAGYLFRPRWRGPGRSWVSSASAGEGQCRPTVEVPTQTSPSRRWRASSCEQELRRERHNAAYLDGPRWPAASTRLVRPRSAKESDQRSGLATSRYVRGRRSCPRTGVPSLRR